MTDDQVIAFAHESDECLNKKEQAAAIKPIRNVPKTLHGQLAALLREHYALALAANKKCRAQHGNGFPLSTWMKGTSPSCKSKIESVVSGYARYPYQTNKASTQVLTDRISAKYKTTLFQQGLIGECVGRKYRGQYPDGIYKQRLIGIAGVQPTAYDEHGYAFFASQDALDFALKKHSLSMREIPLRALLDGRVTMIFLLIQLNTVLKTVPRNNLERTICK